MPYVIQQGLKIMADAAGTVTSVEVDYQLESGKAGTVLVPADTALYNLAQKFYTAVKNKEGL